MPTISMLRGLLCLVLLAGCDAVVDPPPGGGEGEVPALPTQVAAATDVVRYRTTPGPPGSTCVGYLAWNQVVQRTDGETVLAARIHCRDDVGVIYRYDAGGRLLNTSAVPDHADWSQAYGSAHGFLFYGRVLAQGDASFRMMRTSLDGRALWTVTFPEDAPSSPSLAWPLPDGGALVVRRDTDRSATLVAYDATGNAVGDVALGPAEVRSFAPAPSGGYRLLGARLDPSAGCEATACLNPTPAWWEVDAGGSLVGVRSFDVPDVGTGTLAALSAYVPLAGGTGLLVVQSEYDHLLWVARVDADGAVQWAHSVAAWQRELQARGTRRLFHVAEGSDGALHLFTSWFLAADTGDALLEIVLDAAGHVTRLGQTTLATAGIDLLAPLGANRWRAVAGHNGAGCTSFGCSGESYVQLQTWR